MRALPDGKCRIKRHQEHRLAVTMIQTTLSLPEQAIRAFCDRWQITELALFGSILRDDFRPDSGIDNLISYR